uniref:Alcohol dehydrogenase-like C-terminal domain-containing protein n=1 Tax=Sorghum bicolor TaxID=4558 RepID=C6JSN3_SORBI
MCFKLPDNITTKEGALVEPLAVGMHAANQGEVKLGSSVVILGAGTIGLVTLLACKANGATDITVVDVIPKRLEYAKNLGATKTINAAEADVFAEIDKLTDKKGVDVVIETAGTARTISQTPYMVKNGAIKAISKGIIDITGIVTHEFNFDDVANAFDYVINNKQDVVKAVIKID